MQSLVLLSVFFAGVTGTDGVSRVGKVIELLEDMVKKGENEKHDEQVQFATFDTFCTNNIKRAHGEIADAADQIENLNANIQQYIADVARMNKNIAENDVDVDIWAKDKKAATGVDRMELVQFQQTLVDYEETIAAINSAVEVLKAQPKNRAQKSESLLQVAHNKMIPSSVVSAISSFLQLPDEDLAPPKAHAYEFSSDSVIELLWDLNRRFNKEKQDLETKEQKRKGDFNSLVQECEMKTEEAQASTARMKQVKSTKTQQNVTATGDLKDQIQLKQDKTNYMNTLDLTHKTKSKAFEERQKLRTEELEVIHEVVDILGKEVSGKAAETATMAPAFVQLRSTSEAALQNKLSVFLTSKANKLNSHALSMVALRIAADPFKKVKKVIWDLMTRLQEEALAEETQRGFCETELGVNEKERTLKTKEVAQHNGEINTFTSNIQEATQNIAAATQEQTQLLADNKETTKQREEESKKNAATVEDCKSAQEAIAQAITILETFYSKAATATSLAQRTAEPATPEIFDDTPYRGMNAENGGVMGFLEVIQSDYANLQLATETSEEAASKDFDAFTIENLSNQKTQEQILKHQRTDKSAAEENLLQAEADLDTSSKQLYLANQQWDKLKPACVNQAVSYEDRVKQRQEEIESLKEAAAILEGKPYGVSDGIFTAE